MGNAFVYRTSFPKGVLQVQIILSILLIISTAHFFDNEVRSSIILGITFLLINWIYTMLFCPSFLLFEDRMEIRYSSRLFLKQFTYALNELATVEIKTSDSPRVYPQLKVYLKNGKKINRDFQYDKKEDFQKFIDSLRDLKVPVQLKSKGKSIFI